MRVLSLALISIIGFTHSQCENGLPMVSHTMFPKGFMFGASTAAYQVEGGWNADGKGMSIWDNLTHAHPDFIRTRENGDVADDSYHLYKEDVKALKAVGMELYRFSISWPRILPSGRVSQINQAGLDYYMNLIDELLANGITPVVALYHWDLPQALQDIGGWLNPDSALWFEEYADLIFKTYGDKVKWWITINEAWSVINGYGSFAWAPALNLHGTGDYLSGHNLLRAHGKAYRLYQNKYSHFEGKLSMAFCGAMCLPASNSPEDLAAAERCFQFSYGWFAHPVFKGDYPPIMRQMIDRNSKAEGRNVSRLPYFTQQEINEINGTVDWFGLNYYTSMMTKNGITGDNPSTLRDTEMIQYWDPSWPSTASDWVKVIPQGIRALAKKVKEEYGNPLTIVTENGYPDHGDRDLDRIGYFETHFGELRRAIYEDGCNIVGVTIWSIIDNFEWKDGYSVKFGIVEVDFKSPNKTRTLKKSAYWFKNYIEMHKLLE